MIRRLILALAVTAAGCDGSDGSAWTGPEELRPRDGKLDVARFRDHAQAVDEEWERTPEGVAREFLNVRDGGTTFDGNTVVFLRDDLQDDSIRAERWVLELEQQGDEWELVAARWEQRCHAGRGHQQFSPELCL